MQADLVAKLPDYGKHPNIPAEVLARLPDYAQMREDDLRMVSSAHSPLDFSQEWRRSLGGSWADPSIIVDLKNASSEHKSPGRLIRSSLLYALAEMRVRQEFRRSILSEEDLGAYEDYIHKRLGPPGTLVIDHGAYALYVAWRRESKVFLPDNRPELLRSLALDGSFYRVLTPRTFEELVAYMYECLGCHVKLTQLTRDFGADILAWHSGPIDSEFLIAVQVKRYAPGRKVGLKGIFELHGAVTHYGAHAGHLVTTSDFTLPAKRFATDQGYNLVNLKRLQDEILRLFN
jgi:hypothetical protein